MKQLIKNWKERRALRKLNIKANKPKSLGVNMIQRKEEVIISLTTHPARILSSYKTICTLLNQDYKPDKVILWLAKEQFPSINDIPQKIQDLQKYGLTIGWWQDIRSYKKLIPALHEYPNAIIVTVDDDWYYRRDMLKILVEEHQKYPNEIICHAITHPELTDDNKLRMVKEDNEEYRAKSSYFNKILSGSAQLFLQTFQFQLHLSTQFQIQCSQRFIQQ